MKTTEMMLVLGVLLAAGPAFGAGKTVYAKEKAVDYYLQGLKYFQAGDLEKTRTEWGLAAALDPENSDVKAGLKKIEKLLEGAKREEGSNNSDKLQVAPISSVPAPIELAAGYRGISIPVTGDQLLYVKTNDHVDLLLTYEAEKNGKDGAEKERITATILQNQLVLNVRRPEKIEGTGTIEILCNPQEAQYAALSSARGQINVILRAIGDTEPHPMEVASFRRLIR
jgi:hypothetical protein